jgi:hypothetical protein
MFNTHTNSELFASSRFSQVSVSFPFPLMQGKPYVYVTYSTIREQAEVCAQGLADLFVHKPSGTTTDPRPYIASRLPFFFLCTRISVISHVLFNPSRSRTLSHSLFLFVLSFFPQ